MNQFVMLSAMPTLAPALAPAESRLRWLEAENADLKERIDKAYEDIALDQRTNETLRAELAALKANDPLAEMWRELSEYQPMADANGYGEAWAKMCSERTKQAARDAGFAAHAVAVGSRTQLAKLAAHDARDSTLFAGWASGNYVEGLKAVAEDCHSAIDSIRRAKEAKP
jgi:hypothetical protein